MIDWDDWIITIILYLREVVDICYSIQEEI